MPTSYFQLLAHLVVAHAAFERSAELSQLLVKGGLEKAQIKAAHELASDAEQLFAARLEQSDNRIADHGVHGAVTELEMWMQTVRYLLKKRLDPDLVGIAMGDAIHAHEHAATVAAQATRTIAMIRCDDRVAEAIGDTRKCHDVATRGWTLLKKLYRQTDQRLQPEANENPSIFGKLDAHQDKMANWIAALNGAAKSCAEKPNLLGLLGYVPDGVARPVGGTSFAVTLHERTRRSAPASEGSGDCAGWSVGRQQGRNNENLGKGWLEPTFD